MLKKPKETSNQKKKKFPQNKNPPQFDLFISLIQLKQYSWLLFSSSRVQDAGEFH